MYYSDKINFIVCWDQLTLANTRVIERQVLEGIPKTFQ